MGMDMQVHAPDLRATREAWLRHARALAIITVIYNVAEGCVSMGLGWAEDSFALFGFGADSLIEVGSALLVLWRLQGDGLRCVQEGLQKEKRAVLGIAVLFLLLAVGTAFGAIQQLLARRHPDTSVPGVVVSVLSLAFMMWLWRAKRRTATALDSRALAGDAACSLVCIQLSVVLLLGSLLYAAHPALWWADAVAAIVLSGLIALEGANNIRAVRRPDFTGGCGCH